MPNKRALLIGIDEYPRLAADYQLRGAVNDARAMADYLVESLGFTEDDLRLLLNAEATRHSLLDALDALDEATDEEDLVVIHYSGHGSLLRTETGRTGWAWEETIVPHDSGRGTDPNCDVTSLELRQRLLRLTEKTRRLTLVFDCCHSGTLSRDPFAARVRRVPPATDATERPDAGSPTPTYLPRYPERYTLVAACRRDEKTRELRLGGERTEHRGALTHHLLEQLRQAPADATWRDVLAAVSAAVNTRFRDQHPQLEGAVDRLLFDLDERRPMRSVPVREHDPRRGLVVLGAGHVHGVGRGSRWTVYPPGTRQVDDESPSLGRLEVHTVHAATADAAFTGPDPAPRLPPGARAVETEIGDAVARLRVDVAAEVDPHNWSRDLAEEIDAQPLLERSTGPDDADVRVYLLAARSKASDSDPVPSLGAVAEPVYAVVELDEKLLMPIRPLAESGAMATLVGNLARRARWKNARALRPYEETGFEDTIRFRLLRRYEEGWQTVASDGAEFVDGERFAIEIEHRGAPHGRPLHVAVLNFSIDGEISLVYPVEGAWQPIEPGQTVRDGIDEALRFTICESYPYADPGSPVRVSETFKLFVTEESTDFRPLFQNRYRRVRGWRGLYQRSLLGQRLCQLLIGRRELSSRGGGERQSWTVVERSVWIRRPARRKEDP